MFQSSISIIGTGEFGRALGSRLVKHNIPFTFGSRDPLRTPSGPLKQVFNDVPVNDLETCCIDSDVIVLAMHPMYYEKLRYYEHHLSGKLLVDVSNSTRKSSKSNAEKLSAMFPKCHVAKAFNTISSRVMAKENEDRNVYVCANSAEAKSTLMQLASVIGFKAVDQGSLTNSSALEAKARRLFPEWGWACVVVFVISTFWIIFTTCRHFKLRKDPYTPERLPTNMVNKMMGAIAATCLCLTFIPGCLTAFTQLARGTKNVELPRFLEEWLKMRQKLGLFALLFATLHLFLSEALISPAYLKNWYLKTKYKLYINDTYVEIPITTRMNWVGEIVILMGVLSLAILVIMAITTIPSISRSLSWREWRCVHSHLGFVSVLLTACHLTIKGAAIWVTKDVKGIIPTITFLSCILPWITIAMRLVLYMPCVYRRLARIRNGGPPSSKAHGTRHEIPTINNSLTDRELSIVV